MKGQEAEIFTAVKERVAANEAFKAAQETLKQKDEHYKQVTQQVTSEIKTEFLGLLETLKKVYEKDNGEIPYDDKVKITKMLGSAIDVVRGDFDEGDVVEKVLEEVFDILIDTTIKRMMPEE